MSVLQTRWEITVLEVESAQRAVEKAQARLNIWDQSRYRMELAMAWEAGWKARDQQVLLRDNPHLVSTP